MRVINLDATGIKLIPPLGRLMPVPPVLAASRRGHLCLPLGLSLAAQGPSSSAGG